MLTVRYALSPRFFFFCLFIFDFFSFISWLTVRWIETRSLLRGMCQKGREDVAGVVSIRANNYIGDGITLSPVKCFFIWCGCWEFTLRITSFFSILPYQTFWLYIALPAVVEVMPKGMIGGENMCGSFSRQSVNGAKISNILTNVLSHRHLQTHMELSVLLFFYCYA